MRVLSYKFKTSLFLSLIFLSVYNCFGQSKDTAEFSINDFYGDYSIPDFSAFSLLDISGEEIVRPGNIKQLAAGLSNLVGEGNSIRPGIALELSPANFSRLRDSAWWFTKGFRWENIALTLGTVTHDTLGTLASFGGKMVLYDHTSPHGSKNYYDEIVLRVEGTTSSYTRELLNISKEFAYFIRDLLGARSDEVVEVVNSSFQLAQNENFYKNREKLKNGKIQNPVQHFANLLMVELNARGVALSHEDSSRINLFATEYVEYLDKTKFYEKSDEAIIKARENFINSNWYKGALMFSGGIVANSFDNQYETLKLRTFSGICSWSVPWELKKFKKTNAQTIVQLRMDFAIEDTVEYKNKWSFGGRFIVGNVDNRGSIEFLYSSMQLKPNFIQQYDQVRYLRASLGIELKMSKDTWFEIALGGQHFFEGNLDGRTSIIPNLGIKQAITTSKRFKN